MVKSILCLLQRSHVSWKPTNRVKVWDQWQVGFFFVFFSFFIQSGICFRCRLDNPRQFPNFLLPAIGVTADFYIRHFLENRRCSYTINFVQRKHNFCCKWTCVYTYIQGLARSQTSWVLQSTLALSICSHFSIHTLKVT
jgi:hypothetical protein